MPEKRARPSSLLSRRDAESSMISSCFGGVNSLLFARSVGPRQLLCVDMVSFSLRFHLTDSLLQFVLIRARTGKQARFTEESRGRFLDRDWGSAMYFRGLSCQTQSWLSPVLFRVLSVAPP